MAREGTMSENTLREVQAPIMAHYRDDPGAALVTLAADGVLGMG